MVGNIRQFLVGFILDLSDINVQIYENLQLFTLHSRDLSSGPRETFILIKYMLNVFDTRALNEKWIDMIIQTSDYLVSK